MVKNLIIQHEQNAKKLLGKKNHKVVDFKLNIIIVGKHEAVNEK
jgi:hypothetical protein